MKRKKTSEGKSISLAFTFCLIIFVILFLYFGWKVIKVLSLSHFDSKHAYILEVDSPTQKEAITFLPDARVINILHVENMTSGSSLSAFLSVPIDAAVQSQETSLPELLKKQIFTLGKGGLPLVDAIKLWIYTHSIQQGNITNYALIAPSSQETLDVTVPKVFTDRVFYQEAATIAVINASGISGIGNKFAKYLTNIGGNVIMVNTGDSVQDATMLEYIGDDTYSVQKLERILQIRAKKLDKKNTLADITVTVGKDVAGRL